MQFDPIIETDTVGTILVFIYLTATVGLSGLGKPQRLFGYKVHNSASVKQDNGNHVSNAVTIASFNNFVDYI